MFYYRFIPEINVADFNAAADPPKIRCQLSGRASEIFVYDPSVVSVFVLWRCICALVVSDTLRDYSFFFARALLHYWLGWVLS